ncbi:MAG: ATP-binding protein [Candidatus Binatia bacterium]
MLRLISNRLDIIQKFFHRARPAQPLALRLYLIRLVLLLVIPFTLFASTLVVLLAQNEKVAIRSGMEATAHALEIVVDRELESTMGALQTLATSANLVSGNLEGFRKRAERVLLMQKGWNNIILLDASGKQLVSLRPPDQVRAPDNFNLVLQTGKPAVQNLMHSRTGPVVGMSVPVTYDGKTEYVLTANLRTDMFTDLLKQENLPAGWMGVIYDGNRRILARTHNLNETVGQLAAAEISQAIGNIDKGWITAKTLNNNVPSYVAFSKSALSQWSVGIALPTAILDGSVYRHFYLVGGSGLFILGVGIWLALSRADRIARPIENLSEKSAALGKGFSPVVPISLVTEIRELEEKFREADMALYGFTVDLEQRIRERTAELQQKAEILELSHDGILVRRFSDSRIQFWSSGATQLYGWTTQEALGKISHGLLQTHFPQTVEDIEDQLIRQGRWEGELIQTRKNGTRIITASRWSLRRDQAGNPSDVLELDYDITAKKEAEQKLLENERLASLGLTAAVFAHEVANPLHNLNFCLDVLDRELTSAGHVESSSKLVQAASGEVRRLNALLEEFRFLARPQSLSRQRVNFRQIVEEVLAPMRPAQEAARIIVELQFDDEVPQIMVDRDKIKQVIVNLCKNAFEAMSDGGRLTLKSFCSDTSAIFEVSDTGVGIPAGVDVFHLFTTTKSYGTGLGLPIVSQIISAHGGTIDYVSQPGIGTTFKISLPLQVGDEDVDYPVRVKNNLPAE